MRSLWEKEVAFNAFPKSEGDKKTDVLIVGGGMAGILCAHFLQKYGVEYCLVEAGKVAEGVAVRGRNDSCKENSDCDPFSYAE